LNVRRSLLKRASESPVADRYEAAFEPPPEPSTPLLVKVADRIRAPHLFVLDTIGIAIAAFLALSLRFDEGIQSHYLATLVPVTILLVVVRTAVDIRLGLYSRSWLHASVPDLERIVVAASLGSVLTVLIFSVLTTFIVPAPTWPRSFWGIELLLTLAVLGGVRFGIRAAADFSPRSPKTGDGGRPALLYGAGRIGALMARTAGRAAGPNVKPVGFLDDNPHLAGRIVAGVPVYGGIDEMATAMVETGAETLLVTMPSAPGPAVRRVVDRAMALGLEVRTVPSMVELMAGDLDAYRIRSIRVEDLLRRPLVTEHAEGVEDILCGKTVMITGAGGSIGSELARQVFAIRPARLVLVDRAESPLYMLQRELEMRRRHGHGDGEVQIQLANVASRYAMHRLIAAVAPNVIFHAAAYKHVPMMEEHPSDAVHVNMGGTMVVLDAAEAAGVERFVFVSTDKAVRPTSAMGASKRIAEMLVADSARRTGRPYVSVRFGNVLNSTGSVVPIFQEQLENGEALTITHPEMTRFFMTIPEAAWLILDAGALGRSGDLFVLDMGEPVRIMDLARDLVRLAGRDPESQPIEIVGLRSGEKLHEELFYGDETVDRTPSAKVLRVSAEPPPESIRQDVFDMLAIATGDHEDGLRTAVVTYAQNRREIIDGSIAPDSVTAASFEVDPTVAGDETAVSVASPH
jgi:FlaA1/EpsC-like NDP-sugar epimerase